jgi:hypothetical protein
MYNSSSNNTPPIASLHSSCNPVPSIGVFHYEAMFSCSPLSNNNPLYSSAIMILAFFTTM